MDISPNNEPKSFFRTEALELLMLAGQPAVQMRLATPGSVDALGLGFTLPQTRMEARGKGCARTTETFQC